MSAALKTHALNSKGLRQREITACRSNSSENACPEFKGIKGAFVAFGGFPGSLRQAATFAELSFGSFSSGASRVAAVNEDYLLSQFERELWVKY